MAQAADGMVRVRTTIVVAAAVALVVVVTSLVVREHRRLEARAERAERAADALTFTRQDAPAAVARVFLDANTTVTVDRVLAWIGPDGNIFGTDRELRELSVDAQHYRQAAAYLLQYGSRLAWRTCYETAADDYRWRAGWCHDEIVRQAGLSG